MKRQHKQYIIRTIIAIMFNLCSPPVFSQIFEFDQSPPSVKWRQINSDSYQLIYPEEVEEQAQFTARLLDRSMASLAASIRTKPRKIPIILRNQSVQSNGFVQLAPRRSEFFLTPAQQSDPINWLTSLAIHEYRHVVQFDKLTPKAPFELLGMAYFGISLPPWLYEGDAVIMETLLTHAGRGRLPSWEMPLRANTLAGKHYSYQKNYLGSLRNTTAGHYQLGYFMTTAMRKEYGATILDSVFNRMSTLPIRPYNFSNSLKIITGRSTRKWYDQTLAELHELWSAQLAKNQSTSLPLWFADSSKKNDLFLPQFAGEKQVIALAINPEDPPTIIRIDSLGKRHSILKTGRQNTPHFSYANGKITWDEIRYDMRFHKQDYSVINLYDLTSKTYRQLSRKSRLFSPVLNPEATRLAALEISLSGKEHLLLLSTETGQELDRIPVPQGYHIQSPSFHPNGRRVIATAISNQGASLIEFNFDTRSSSILLSHLNQPLERPIYAGEDIIFKAAFNGIDNLYRLDPQEGSINALTNVPYGAFNPAYQASTNSLLFNNYQAYGYQISRLALDPLNERPIHELEDTFIRYFEPLIGQEAPPLDIDSIERVKLPWTPYKEGKNLFNFHSVSIGSDDFESIGDLKLGLLLLSDNLLNTLSARMSAAYDQNIHRPEFGASLSYQRYFPKFNVEYTNSGRLSGIKTDPNSNDLTAVRWRENEFNFNIEIPLAFNRLNQFYNAGLKIGTSYTQRYRLDRPEIQDRFIHKLAFPMDYQVYFNRNDQRSAYDLAPKWGQNFSLFFRNSPFQSQLSGNAFALQSAFYFPGILKNHSLRSRLSFQHHSGNFQYSNYIPMVKGYDQLRPSSPENTLLVDYRFPIAYPDWELGPLAYIQRIKGGFFSHYEDLGRNSRFKPRTFGAEIRADMNLFRFFLPLVDMGMTAIYVNEPHDSNWLFEFGFSYSY